ncbi:MAG: plastocyanin/azurin family copper-binding protein [Thalassobaculaceae bacterium]|nr:plastocyanin/azurin family copper-binding protein [Thalassobaculaceae bacterium]
MSGRFAPAVCAIVLGTGVGAGIGAGVGVAWAATEHVVIQKHRSFRPGEVTVKAGDTVAFLNDDFYDHNVYSETPGSIFNIGVQTRGETTRVTLEQPGTVDILCRIHPKMKLVVTVE